MDNFETLNAIYQPLCDKSAEISRELKKAGYQVRAQFHNNHSVKRGNEFATEVFPIPVIFIEGIGSIGVDLDSVWFEAVLTKEQAIAIDYEKIIPQYTVEIYGSDQFLCDLYHGQMDAREIVGKISQSPEKKICILFYLGADVPGDDLIRIAQLVAG